MSRDARNGPRPDPAPEEFARAVAAVRGVPARPGVAVEETPAPQRLAPYALALTGNVLVDGDEAASGRLVLLHDPAGHEAWEGTFRLVGYARAALEPEMAADPLLAGVGWAWLVEALGARQAPYAAASGTVTRVASESFGGMADEPAAAEIEIRASWSPLEAEVAPHVEAWVDLLRTAAGLPPVVPGVVAMPTRPAHTRRTSRSGRGAPSSRPQRRPPRSR